MRFTAVRSSGFAVAETLAQHMSIRWLVALHGVVASWKDHILNLPNKYAGNHFAKKKGSLRQPIIRDVEELCKNLKNATRAMVKFSEAKIDSLF